VTAAETLRTRMDHATAGLDPPLAVVDLDAFDANAADLERRAGAKPIRVASKSVRCRALLERVLTRPGFTGVMAFTLPEALWLTGHGFQDVLVAYPTADRAALRRLADDPAALAQITLMVDDRAHLDLLGAVTGADVGTRGPRGQGARPCASASTSTPHGTPSPAGCASVPADPPCARRSRRVRWRARSPRGRACGSPA